jgi:putative phosphonate catabolism associated alcohol dehydrogenase
MNPDTSSANAINPLVTDVKADNPSSRVAMTSRAAVFEGLAGEMTLRQLLIPKLHESEVLVRVSGCTICGSDLHSFHGRRTVPVPTILGHEIVGEIIDIGGTSARFDLEGGELHRGDRVTWAIMANCGVCDLCRRGLPQKCSNGVKYGHEPFRPGRELSGGLAEHCLLVPGTSIVKLPAELPLAVACPASCATATIAAALEAAGDLNGRTVCLSGAGMLGLTACAMSRVQGAAKVVSVDPVPARRKLAMEFGATRICAPDDLAAVAIEEVGTLGFDVVIELSGNPAAFQAVWPLIRTGGTLVLVGSVFPGPAMPIALEQVVRRHLTIRGIHNYAPHHLLNAVKFLSAAYTKYPFDRLVTEWISLNSIADAFGRGSHPDAIRIGVYSSDRPLNISDNPDDSTTGAPTH